MRSLQRWGGQGAGWAAALVTEKTQQARCLNHLLRTAGEGVPLSLGREGPLRVCRQPLGRPGHRPGALCALTPSEFGLAESMGLVSADSWLFLGLPFCSVYLLVYLVSCALREWLRRWCPWSSFLQRAASWAGQPPHPHVQVPAGLQQQQRQHHASFVQRQGTERSLGSRAGLVGHPTSC